MTIDESYASLLPYIASMPHTAINVAADAVAMQIVNADVEAVDADIVDAETADVVAAVSEKRPTD